jgi:hypothetical protein
VRDADLVAERRVDERRQRADAQRSPIVVAPRRNDDGSTTVSAPIATPASISVLAGSTIVTPARMWRSWMRAGRARARGELDAVVDAEQQVGSSSGARRPSSSSSSVDGQVELALGVVGGQALEGVLSAAPSKA